MSTATTTNSLSKVDLSRLSESARRRITGEPRPLEPWEVGTIHTVRLPNLRPEDAMTPAMRETLADMRRRREEIEQARKAQSAKRYKGYYRNQRAALLALLADLCRIGAPLPPRAEMARDTGYTHPSDVSRALRYMEMCRDIELTPSGGNKGGDRSLPRYVLRCGEVRAPEWVHDL